MKTLIVLVNFSILAASVLRMFYHSFTALTFTKGLKIFLNYAALNPLGVIESQQLYDALQQAVDNYNNGSVLKSGYKVAELFGNWEQQEGYPILYVERSYNDHRVRFIQVNQLRGFDIMMC